MLQEFLLNKFKNLRKTYPKITSYEITKRQRFILQSIFLTGVLVAAQTVSESSRYNVIGLLTVSAILLSIFSLKGELSGIKYILLLLLPAYFVAGASLFYFLLPVRWLTRVPFALLFGISVYLLMLTANIYNVAAIRTIALLRAAHAVGLLFSVVSTFFLANVLFSLHLAFYLVVAGAILITFPLYLVGVWSYELEEFISQRVFLYAVIFALATAEIGLVLSFWPIAPINGALTLATIIYVFLGLAQFQFTARLKRRIVAEYLGVALIVGIVVMISTRWG